MGISKLRRFWSFATFAGLLGGTLGSVPAPVVAQGSDYRAAGTVPAAWKEFATQLQRRFEQRLAADDDAVRRFQDEMAKRGEGGASAMSLIVRTWILPNGKIGRIEVDGPDRDIAVDLSALLTGGDVGMPPADMRQPLHLRLSLHPKEASRQGE